MHIQSGKSGCLRTGYVGGSVIANHQAFRRIEQLPVNQSLEEPCIRFAAHIIGGNLESVKGVVQTEKPKLILGEGMLRLAE